MHKCLKCEKTFDTYPIECDQQSSESDCPLIQVSKICLAHPFGKGQNVGYNDGEKQMLCCLNPEDNPPFTTVLSAATCPKCISFIQGLNNGNS